MAPRGRPGLAFWIVCDSGFAVWLVTHRVARYGDLVWIAEPTFDEEPTVSDVEKIEKWRWPVFFPLGPALHRKLVTSIGVVPIPEQLKPFPMLRGSRGPGKWALVKYGADLSTSQSFGPTSDPSVPISQVVNDTSLREKIVSGWRPEDRW